MEIPPQGHQIWDDIVRGTRTFEFESLAVQILQGALFRSVAKDSSPENITICAKALRDLFAKNAKLPSVQKDLEKIRTS
jgi:hypothetical protein